MGKLLKLGGLAALATILAILPPSVPAYAQAGCTFAFGFKTLHDAIPEIVGDCRGDQRPGSGGIVQPTANGVFLWMPERNVTLFLRNRNDVVWLLGPVGVQSRLADEYFDWEVANGQEPLTGVEGRPNVPVGSRPPPAPPPPPHPGPSPEEVARRRLGATCFSDYGAETLRGWPNEDHTAEANALYFLCNQAIDQDGELGLTCYRSAYDAARGLAVALPGSTRAASAYDDAYRACIKRGGN